MIAPFFALAACLLIHGSGAAAAEDAETLKLAKSLFEAGRKAYASERYEAAIGLFERSYQLTKRPPVIYSLAQAYRMQYLKDDDPAKLSRAIELLTSYLEQVPSGAFHDEAAEQVRVLSALRAKLEAEAAPKAADTERLARLADEARQAKDAGRFDTWLGLLRRAAGIDPSPARLSDLARALEDSGRYAEAARTYSRVVSDPRAPKVQVDRSRDRLEQLTARLGRAWLQPDPLDVEGGLTIDGQAPILGRTLTGTIEIGLEPRPHVLEYRRGPNEIAVVQVNFRADTSTISFDDSGSAHLVWGRVGPPWPALTVDGHEIRWGTEVQRIDVMPGQRRISARLSDGVEARTLDLAPGATVSLDQVFHESPSRPLAALAARPVEPREPSIAPWIFGIGGVVAGTTGAILYANAASQRQGVEDVLSRGGVITAFTMADAENKAGHADTLATAGAVCLAVGAAAISTGAVWWLIDRL